MFAKLLKHEWKSCSRLLTILSLAALGLGIVGAGLLRYLVGALTGQTDETMSAVSGILLSFVVLGLVAYVFGAYIYLVLRFYRNKFTDEGYLTFTLPVKSWQILLSSFVNFALWVLIVAIVASVAVCLITLAGVDGVNDLTGDLHWYYEDLWGADLWRSILSGIVSYLSGIMITLTCVTLGAVIAKKHKLLAAMGIYYGYSLVVNILSAVLMVSYVVAYSEGGLAQSNYVYEIIAQLLLAVGGFFLSSWLMDRKLNLP